jgi:predicted DNA binding protein
MSFIAEAVFDSPLFRETLAAVPDVELRLEDIRTPDGEPRRFVFWVDGGDFQRFESAMDADPTVGNYRCLTASDGKRLYRTTIPEGTRDSLYAVTVEQDILILELVVTAEGKRVLSRVPSREAVVQFRQACSERGFGFRLERLYREEVAAEDGGIDDRYGVTAAQREALSAALEMGYFEVPRDASLEHVADELDISRQALSTRLRRGQSNLLRNTLS